MEFSFPLSEWCGQVWINFGWGKEGSCWEGEGRWHVNSVKLENTGEAAVAHRQNFNDKHMMRITYWILITCWGGVLSLFYRWGHRGLTCSRSHSCTKEPHPHLVCPEHRWSCLTAAFWTCSDSQGSSLYPWGGFTGRTSVGSSGAGFQSVALYLNFWQLWTNHSTFLDLCLNQQNILHPSFQCKLCGTLTTYIYT